MQHVLYSQCCNVNMAMMYGDLHYFTLVDVVPTLCFSMTIPSSPWDIKYNTYGTCKCRSSTNSNDTSPRICHNCSCGKKSCRKSGDTARKLGLCELMVPKYVLMIHCSVLGSCLEVAEPLHSPFICMSNIFKYKYIFVVISHLASQSNKTRQAM